MGSFKKYASDNKADGNKSKLTPATIVKKTVDSKSDKKHDKAKK